MRTKTRKWIPFFFFSFFLITVSVYGSGEVKEKNSDESTMMLELLHREDARISGNEIKKNGIERFKEIVQTDIIRFEKIGRRLGHGVPRSRGRDNEIGQYLVQVRVGTPGQKFWLVADTGSGLTSLNCRYNFDNGGGRRSGGRQPSFDGGKRLFDAGSSKSFHKLLCSSKLCSTDTPLFSLTTCQSPSADPCRYEYSYEDRSRAKGLFGTDTITVGLTNGRKARIQNLLIDCKIDGGTLTEDGVLGLGIAKDSFVEKAALKNGGMFFYCLNDPLSHKSSYLTFGDYTKSKTKLLSGIQDTELLIISPFYAVHLESISIEGQNLKLPPKIFDRVVKNGTVVIDSSSTLTTLPLPVYKAVIDVLMKYLNKCESVLAIDPFKYCYNVSGCDVNSLPRLVFYFAGGVRFEPDLKSYLIDVRSQVKCIGLLPGPTQEDLPGISVIGNIMQQNHLWGFDLLEKVLRFAPSTCS